MAEILFDKVPSLDLADFTSGSDSDKKEFVSKLGEAYTNIGFVSIKNHGLSDALISRLYSSIEKFFAFLMNQRNAMKLKVFLVSVGT